MSIVTNPMFLTTPCFCFLTIIEGFNSLLLVYYYLFTGVIVCDAFLFPNVVGI
jgi:hypothetical protein